MTVVMKLVPAYQARAMMEAMSFDASEPGMIGKIDIVAFDMDGNRQTKVVMPGYLVFNSVLSFGLVYVDEAGTMIPTEILT